ncbi:hypothetical protein JTB14_019994 [Gonioctena quinquepunctata]|nr:hypothetical protein JTB14_019994 [Gonioctena quinquepunctata]
MKLKNSESRRSKSCLAIVSETYKDFADNTSIQGLKYTVKNEIETWEKIFWIIVVICGICCATYMTILFWGRYISNPTRTTILTSYAPVTTLPFPAVTICNINRILVTKIDKLIQKMDLIDSEKTLVEKALPQLLAFNYPNEIEYNVTELNVLQEVLERNNLTDISSVMEELSQSCDEMLTSCSWERISIKCSDFFGTSLTSDGYCCSFNYRYGPKPSGLFAQYNGELTGIVVLMNPMLQPVQYSSLYSSGFKIMIHDPTEYPGMQSTIKLVSVGKVSYLQILGTKLICSEQVKNLPVSQRNCLYPNERRLISFDTEYSSSNCAMEDISMIYFRNCGCVPYYLSFVGKPLCNISNIACLTDIRKRNSGENLNCDCPSQCEDNFYTIMSTSTTLEFNLSKTLLTLYV